MGSRRFRRSELVLTYWPYRLAIRNNFVVSLLGVAVTAAEERSDVLRLRSFGEGGCSSYH